MRSRPPKCFDEGGWRETESLADARAGEPGTRGFIPPQADPPKAGTSPHIGASDHLVLPASRAGLTWQSANQHAVMQGVQKGLPSVAPNEVRSEGGWRDSELNRGHADFQSAALPTELSRHIQISIHNKRGSCASAALPIPLRLIATGDRLSYRALIKSFKATTARIVSVKPFKINDNFNLC